MINLQPYQNPTYFVLLAAALLPLAIGLLYGKRFKVYEMIVSFAFLLLTFGGVKLNEGLALLGYVIFETLLVCGSGISWVRSFCGIVCVSFEFRLAAHRVFTGLAL